MRGAVALPVLLFCLSGVMGSGGTEATETTHKQKTCRTTIPDIWTELNELNCSSRRTSCNSCTVCSLERHKTYQKVAFSVGLTDSGPVNTQITLTYSRIITSQPNCRYLHSTIHNGLVYNFTKMTWLCIIGNTAGEVDVYITHGSSLELKQGDVVYRSLHQDMGLYDTVDNHSTFSGLHAIML
ncbi:unnamed protein product [Coregonus sp. 'balchen']|nr:unnamed protein product [Coregonus sp. 'balchen']